MTSRLSVVGLIAGAGRYPVILFRRLVEKGMSVVVFGLQGQVNPENFAGCTHFESFPVGQLGGMVRCFRNNGVVTAYMAGAVRRSGLWRHVSLDRYGLYLAPEALFGHDDSFLRSVSAFFTRHGVAIVDPGALIGDLLASPGRISGPCLSSKLAQQIDRAVSIARDRLVRGVGQAAIVYDERVSLVEDRSGTDAMISRSPGPGALLLKFSRRGQDRRFDLPAIGPSTICAASMVGISAIAVEAGSVLLLDRERICELCDQRGIVLYGIGADIPAGENGCQSGRPTV